MKVKQIRGDARELWTAEAVNDPTLAWLGQAGFVLRFRDLRVLIDPYLSDTLRPRLLPAPLAADDLAGIQFVLCTHRHGDHLDVPTLLLIAQHYPECRFVVPKAEVEHAVEVGLPRDRIIGVDAGETHLLAPDFHLLPLPSAHEDLLTNAAGQHRYLGYVVRIGSNTFYHSGDTVLYPGLVEAVRPHAPDLALLPVNGRGKGVQGNLTFAEAVDLCWQAGIPALFPHHHGMFAYNTLSEVELTDAKIKYTNIDPRVFWPDPAWSLELR